MKRHIYLLVFLCLQTTSIIIAQNQQQLVILMKSGELISLPIDSNSKITFDGTIMSVGDGDYQIANVRKWMVGDPENIIQGVETAQIQNSINYLNGVLTVGEIKEVHIYNVAGVEMQVSVRNGRVDMRALPADTYIIKVGKEVLKIRKQ